MAKTLSYKDTIRRIGFTVIDDVKVVQYDCLMPTANPKDMKIVVLRLNEALYKANLITCKNDQAEFEEAARKLQETYLSMISDGE